MSARDVVLGRLRSALGPAPAVPEVPRGYRQRGDLETSAVVSLFLARVDDYRARVHRCRPDEVAEVVARALGTGPGGEQPQRVVVPADLDDAWLAGLPGDAEVIRDTEALSAADLDRFDAVVTAAAVGIAETGTVVLDGGPDQGRRAITLVPDHHVCVVRADQVVQTVPEALARLVPTRPLTLISGPSATSDIELERVEGVHGPRTLDVVLVT